MKRIAALATALLLGIPGPSWAQERECTPRDTRERAGELAREIHESTGGDPEKARQIHEELGDMRLKHRADSLPRTEQGLEDECARYEQRMDEVEKATDQLE